MMIQHRNHRGVERISDRESRMVFSTGAKQYDRGDGWRDIDTTLESIGGNHWFMDRAPYACGIPKRADKGVRFEYDGGGFSWIPLCAPVEGIPTRPNVITYKDAFGNGIHLELAAGNNSLKKLIVIEKKPQTIPDYVAFYFKMPCDDNPEIRGRFRGLVSLFENKAYIWQATVVDAAGNTAHIPLDFAVINGDLHMVKRIPRAILEHFKYPIKTDADVSYTTGTGDGCVYKTDYGWDATHDATSGTANHTDTEATIAAVAAGVYPVIYRAFFPFDTTGLPVSVQVTAAKVTLIKASGTSPNLRLTECFQASTSSLTANDYNDNGYDAGHEEAGRSRYAPAVAGANDVLCSPSTVFTCNSTGMAWIKADGATWTMLGVRQYHDCQDIVPSSSQSCAFYSSNHANSDNHPTLAVTYQSDYVAPEADGALGWGGAASYGVEIGFAGSGGFGIGGAARIIGPVQYDTSNAVSFAADIKEIDRAVASTTATGFTINSAVVLYRRPTLTWRSTNTSETTIQLSWKSGIDTLLLYNCNFTDFEIDTATTDEFETIQDPNTGLYHGIARINQTASGIYTGSTNALTLVIPAQTPTDGGSYFKIGSIVGAVRKQFTFPPRYPFKKELIEPVRRRDFDGGSAEIEETGNPYHILDYGWDAISYENFKDIETVVEKADIIGACIIHEKWDDYEVVYLGTIQGDFDYSVDNRDRKSARIVFRELN